VSGWPEVPLWSVRAHAGWLNRVAPCWKQLRSLSLRGWRFDGVDEIIEAEVGHPTLRISIGILTLGKKPTGFQAPQVRKETSPCLILEVWSFSSW
jgi:hypothetical protein